MHSMKDGNRPPLHGGDTVYNGQYIIIGDTANAGGFGRIYRALDSSPIKRQYGRKYAVKEFLLKNDISGTSYSVSVDADSPLNEQELRKKFCEEANLLSLMGQQASITAHIPTIFGEPVEEAGRLMYVMEYVEGPTIAEEVNTWGPMSEKKAVSLVVQVARVLHYAHNHGLIHCDVSPNNIILRNENTAVLVDFGNARSYDDETALEEIERTGTPGFVAPQPLYGRPEGDVYSLASTLYYMLTGRVPGSCRKGYGEEVLTENLNRNHISQATIEAIKMVLVEKLPVDIRTFISFLSEQIIENLLFI